MLKWKKTIIFIALLVISAAVISDLMKTTISSDIKKFCTNEEQFYQYIKSLEFETVKFSFLKIQRGDNYWKIAKHNNISIDSLIGNNIYWPDLLARLGRTVAVPDQDGVIEFIASYDDLKNLIKKYEVTMKEVEVQKTPFMNKYYYKYDSDRMPIAVFIKGVRPDLSNMTASLAGKYELRQMFRSPLGGRLSSFFGVRKHPVFRKKKFHNGLDIAARYGTYVGAARTGVVTSAGWMGGYGKAVIIQHDRGYRTLYGHMSRIFVKPGQKIKAGRFVGRVGSTGLSTGPHLHFTLWHNEKLLNPMNVLW